MLGSEQQRDKYYHICQQNLSNIRRYLFDIPFDRQQLADYLCIDRAAMSTEISKVTKRGLYKNKSKSF